MCVCIYIYTYIYIYIYTYIHLYRSYTCSSSGSCSTSKLFKVVQPQNCSKNEPIYLPDQKKKKDKLIQQTIEEPL